MPFKWDTGEKEPSFSIPDIDVTENDNDITLCNTYTTCPRYDEKELKEFQRIKACWDNMQDIQYDKRTGCFFKVEDNKKSFSTMERVPFAMKCMYQELV